MTTTPSDHPIGIHLRAFNWQLWRTRTRLGFTQQQLADLAGVSVAKVSQFETLRGWPTANQADALADLLGANVGVLFPDALRERCANVPASVRFSVPLAALPAREGPVLLEAGDPLEAIFNDELRAGVAKVMETLTPRERKVLTLRFGLDGEESRSLRATSEAFNVTPGRIQQIEAKALRKLRHPSRSKGLKGYLE